MIAIGITAKAAANGRFSRDVLVDDVADHRAEFVPPMSSRRDVVAERQREGEDRAGDDSGQRERQDHAPERPPAARAEVGGRLEVRVRDPLERGVDRAAP